MRISLALYFVLMIAIGVVLVMRIQQEGLPVQGFGSAKTPEAFRQACSRFIDVDALIEVDKRNRGGGESDVKATLAPNKSSPPAGRWRAIAEGGVTEGAIG